MSTLVPLLKKPLVALAIVAAVAGVLRFHHLGQPPERVFDEVYYSKDGCLYAGHSPKECDLTSSGEKYWVIDAKDTRGETSWVHPQLGKWMIAAGILGEGNNPFGWRVAAAAAGTATAVITAYIALLLFGSILWTYVSGLLLATETLNFVQSRTSMLDVFLAFWVLLGFMFLLLDRRWIERKTPALSQGPGAMAVDEPVSEVEKTSVEGAKVPSPIWRPWRFAAGFAFGCAASTKWSGALALGGAALLAAFWEITRRRRAGDPKPIWNAIRLELLGGVLAFLILPVVVYLVSYTRYFVVQDWHAFIEMQRASFHFHHSELPYMKLVDGTLENTHPYESKPWTWLAMLRPVSYYFKGPGREILAMGHPLLFWSSVFTIPAASWIGWRRRDYRAAFIVVAILAQYLPWFLAAGQVQFFFYITPVTPFLVLAAVYVLKALSDVPALDRGFRPFVPVVATYLVVYLALFAFFYPVLTGWHLSYEAWHVRMWMPSWI